jgi:hypothetical protein
MSEQALNRLGYYRIASTTSAIEAVCLARCVASPFDILIVDHDILQPSGLALVERFQQQGLARHFILSGNPPPALRLHAKKRCPALLGSLSAPSEMSGFRLLLSHIDPTISALTNDSQYLFNIA